MVCGRANNRTLLLQSARRMAVLSSHPALDALLVTLLALSHALAYASNSIRSQRPVA
jgi:hypothetical protein